MLSSHKQKELECELAGLRALQVRRGVEHAKEEKKIIERCNKILKSLNSKQSTGKKQGVS